MKELAFNKSVVLAQLRTIETNLSQVVEARKLFVSSLVGRTVRIYTRNPITWFFPKEIVLTEGKIKYIANMYFNDCASIYYYENKLEIIKNKINYLYSSLDREVFLSEHEFNEINKEIKDSASWLNLSKEEERFVSILSKPIDW